MNRPVDQAARARALDPRRSFLVEAPAGSGKTELLTRRMLRLLSVSEEPEQILAITFTRKAAAEMRRRVLEALVEAEEGREPENPERGQLAREALARSVDRGWELLANPSRLRITTIDAFSAHLVGRLPWLSRAGGVPRVTENAGELYEEAARRVLARLESGDEAAGAVALVLRRQGNRSAALRELLRAFLARRDRWVRHRRNLPADADLRPLLEGWLRSVAGREAYCAARVLAPHMGAIRRLAAVSGEHAEAGQKFATLRGAADADWESPDSAGMWRAAASLLLTKEGTVRKRLTPKEAGLPPAGGDGVWKEEVKNLLDRLREDPEAAPALERARRIPDPSYGEGEWEALGALARTLDLSISCLDEVMRERGACDFAEVSLRALAALGEAQDPSDLMLALDRRIAHILVDEFQDTSHLQFELLERLTEGWEPGDGRTLFLVGDPMQSIYRFREAEVGLFHRAAAEGIGPVELERLGLKTNFRSRGALVSWFNDLFPGIFPEEDRPDDGAVAYRPCVSAGEDGNGDAVAFRPSSEADGASEAREVADEVEAILGRDPGGRVAVLVRSRSHLPPIVRELTARGIPFRGEDLTPLAETETVRDIRSLAAALLDPCDRTAWLSVLRAPWCGLTLGELLALAEGDGRPIPRILRDEDRLRALNPQARARLARVRGVLFEALEGARRAPLRTWLERVWAELGAPAYLSEAQLEDASAAFDLLEALSKGGGLPPAREIDAAFKDLFAAPDPEAPDTLHVMTIHKAKGLEFDSVLLPGLGRRTMRDAEPLLRWVEFPRGELLFAPFKSRTFDAETGTAAEYLKAVERAKEENEWVRLLYVAATRAGKRLRMWGHAKVGEEASAPEPSSLLGRLWPAVADSFEGLPVTVGRGDTAARFISPEISRLPDGWVPPAVVDPEGLPRSAEPRETPGDVAIDYWWAGLERRHVGTVAHRFFERMAGEGIEAWSRARVEEERGAVQAKLIALGVGSENLGRAVDEVVEAALALLEDPEGRRLLTAADARSEYGLMTSAGGRIESRRVDRTFLDGEGVRWIVDFKVSAHLGGDVEAFLAAERERHRPQLEGYARLFRALEPGRIVRTALYYPLLRRFVEVGAE